MGNEFLKALEEVINKYSKENDSNTPDFILAEYLHNCLDAFTRASRERERWYGKSLSINGDDNGAISEQGETSVSRE